MACAAGGVRYEVKAQEPVLVQPLSHATADSHAYFLTNLDQAVAPLVVETVMVFDANTSTSGIDPAGLLKEALGKVLVDFYPLAGRLRISPDHGKLFIECNAQGISFVEADANVDISELGDLLQPHAAPLGALIFPLPATDDHPLLTVQVTRFKCGGFVVGFVLQHCVFDGVAALEFVNAWAETARGAPLSMPPVLDRTFLSSRSPLQIKYPHTEFLEIEDLSSTETISGNAINRSFCFTPASLAMVRKKALEDGLLSKCTTFQALSGLIWRARTRAIWSDHPEQKVKLLIFVDKRSAGLPKGYVGNGVVLTCALASAGELAENPLSHAVKHVQDAIGRATDEYMRSQIDYMEHEMLGLPPLGATLGITTWSTLSYNNVDFGWGKPKHAGPVSSMANMEVAIFLSHGQDRKAMNVMLRLPPKAMQKFEELLHPHLNPVFLSPKL